MSTPVPTQQWDTDRVFTLPNVLSFIRLLGIPVFCWLILAGHDVAAVVMLIVFGITDWFDGYLARAMNQRSALGAKLDPIADRLYILATVIVLVVRGIVPWWLLAILLARDVMIALLVPALKRHGIVALPVNMTGKTATMLLLMAFPLILIGSPTSLGWAWAHWAGWVMAVIGAILYWAAGFIYLKQTIDLGRRAE